MAAFCICGICIPYSVIWPFILLIVKRVYEIIFPASSKTKQVEEDNAMNASEKPCKVKSCCIQKEEAWYLESIEEWKSLMEDEKKVFAKFTGSLQFILLVIW